MGIDHPVATLSPTRSLTLALRRGAPPDHPDPPRAGHVSTRVHAETPFWNSRKRVKDDHPVATLSPTRSLTLALRRGAPPGRSL